MSRYRPLTAAAKASAATLAAATLVLASAGVASAHVTIGPDATAKYGTDVELTFPSPTRKPQQTPRWSKSPSRQTTRSPAYSRNPLPAGKPP